MRLLKIWEDLCRMNSILKYLSAVLLVTNLFLVAAVLRLSTKEPLIFERECNTTAVDAKPREVTTIELAAFLKEALSQRFDTASTSTELLSVEEALNQKKEFDELSRREMRQIVFIEKYEGDGKTYKVNLIRLISLGTIRSALPLEIEVTIDKTERSRGNPYGLVLIKTRDLSSDNSKKAGDSK